MWNWGHVEGKIFENDLPFGLFFYVVLDFRSSASVELMLWLNTSFTSCFMILETVFWQEIINLSSCVMESVVKSSRKQQKNARTWTLSSHIFTQTCSSSSSPHAPPPSRTMRPETPQKLQELKGLASPPHSLDPNPVEHLWDVSG